jgi:hypothetical protein
MQIITITRNERSEGIFIHIADAIIQGIAVAASDGSFKEGYATSAWILQGRDTASQRL